MFDQANRFLIEVKNAEKIAELNKLLDQNRDTVRGLAKDLHAGTINHQQYIAQAKPAAAASVALTKDIDKLKASTRDLGQATLAAGHTFQDLIQGGFGGVLNNIPQLIEKLGGSAGLAGGFTLVTVAAYAAYPIVNSLWEAIAKGSAEIPKSSDAVDRLTESLKDSKERLEAMKESWRGTAEEVAAYNAILAETARIEKEVDEAQKQRKETEAARGQKTDDQSALARDFGKISGGADYDAIVANAGPNTLQGRYNALRKEYDALTAAFQSGKGLKGDEGVRLRDLSARLNEMAKGGGIDGLDGEGAVVKQVQEMVNKARQGDLKAFDELLKATTGRLREQLQSIDPRGAASRAFNKTAAESRIADAISDVVAPAVSGLRQRNQAIRDIRETDRDMQAMADKVAPRQQARASRMAGYRAEMREAETSTPEELRQSEALEYLERYVKRNDPGAKLSNKEQLEVSGRMIENRDAGMSAREATEAALRDQRNGVRLNRDVREGAQIAGIASREFGVALSPEQAATALKEARDLVQQGMAPNVAGRQAIMGVVQDIVGMVRQNIEAANFQAAEIAQMRMFIGQLRQAQQVAPTLLNQGR